MGRHRTRLSPRHVDLLGTVPDAHVARRAGVHPATVRGIREAMGIPPCREGRGRPPVEWTPALDALLGTDTDANVAARLGVCTATVHARRRALGIPPKFGRGRHSRASKWDGTDIRDVLARLRDKDAAAHYGLTRERVRQLRLQLGVAAPPRPLPAADPARAAIIERLPSGDYRVRCRCGREYTHPKAAGPPPLCGRCPKRATSRTDYAGRKFSRLTVRRRADENDNVVWLCDCDCGTRDHPARINNLLRGLTKSCGCRRAAYVEAMRRSGGGFGWPPGERPA